jgi:MFS family permease
MALPFLVLYLSRSLNFSPSRAGIALAVYGGVALVVGPVAGLLSDRWGPLRLMEGSLLSSGLVLLLFPLAHSWPAVLIMTILFAITGESFRPANLSLISDLGPLELRKPAFALSRWAVNLGMSVGPALGGLLAQKSFSLLFIVDGVTTLSAAAILIFSPFHSSVKNFIMAKKEDRSKVEFEEKKRWPLATLFIDSDLRFLLLAILPVSIVFFQHESSMPLHLVRNLNFSESSYGLLFTINTLLIIVLEIPLNSATSHWSLKRTLSLGALLFGIGFGALTVAQTYFQVAITVVIWTFGEMILFPGMSTYISEIAPDGKSGEYMGLYLMSFSLAFMVAPWIGTLVLERLGATSLWSGALMLGLLSAIALKFIRDKRAIL